MAYKEMTWTDDDVAKMGQLQDLGESVEKMNRPSGPIGATRIAMTVMRSEKASEMASLLPWLLTRKLGNHIFEQEKIVARAALTPSVHEALKSVLPPILHDFVYDSDCAGTFLTPAHCIAKSDDADLIAMALPLFPEALKRASWASSNFGNLSCDLLDIGGNPDDIIPPLKSILESQTDDPESAFCRQNKEVKLAKFLCSQGFMRLLNHPRVKESKPLTRLLQPYAGEIIEDDRKTAPLFRKDIYVLASIQGKRTGFTWAPSAEYARYVPINHVSAFKGEFIERSKPEDVAEIAIRLFEKMKDIPNRGISSPAHRAVKSLKSEFGEAIRDLAANREMWGKSDAELEVLEPN